MSGDGVIKSRARELALAAIFAAMMAGGALVSIPFFPVPLSLQTFFVYLGVLLLRKSAWHSQAIYIAMGIAGLPVFSRGMAGYAVLLGPTGGFLAGFLIGSLISGLLISKVDRNLHSDLAAMALCMSVIFGMGWLWLAYWMQWNFAAAAWAGVIPFLPGDLLKIALAVAVSRRIRL